MSKRGNYVILPGNPWENLAIAIIASGVEADDERFFKSKWCRYLCEMLGMDYDKMLSMMGCAV